MSMEILFLNLAKSLQDQVSKGLSLWYIVEGFDTRVELRTQHFNHYETVNLFWYRSYACVIPRSGSDRFLVLSTSYMTA